MAIFIRKSYTNFARICLLNLLGKKWSIYQIKMFKPLIFVLFAITTGTLKELNATFLFNTSWCLLRPAPGSILCSNLFHHLATKASIKGCKKLKLEMPAPAPVKKAQLCSATLVSPWLKLNEIKTNLQTYGRFAYFCGKFEKIQLNVFLKKVFC